MSADQERALRLGMDRTHREMPAGQDDTLTSVEFEWRRELEAWDRPIELDGPGLELW